jgi:hypothetical protein
MWKGEERSIICRFEQKVWLNVSVFDFFFLHFKGSEAEISPVLTSNFTQLKDISFDLFGKSGGYIHERKCATSLLDGDRSVTYPSTFGAERWTGCVKFEFGKKCSITWTLKWKCKVLIRRE